MTSYVIEDRKAFSEALFIGTVFDRFLVREAAVVTFNSFTIDGSIRQGYYSAEEKEQKGIGEFSAWQALKPICYQLIKGRRLPESFRFVFMLPPEGRDRFAKSHAPELAQGAAGCLFLNIIYENGVMSCVTGLSMNIFTMDRTLEHEWDREVGVFLKRNGIAAIPGH